MARRLGFGYPKHGSHGDALVAHLEADHFPDHRGIASSQTAMCTMRLPTAKTQYKVRVCMGGPWSAQEVLFPVQAAGDPLSLPIVVNGCKGRYNLNTGAWVPTVDPEEDRP